MLVRLSRAPVALSGGLRRKTQLFSCTLYAWSLSRDPTSPVQGPQSSNPAKCQFSQGTVRCVIIPKVKKHQTQLHSTLSWSATGLRGRKIKRRS
ncbi:hypothetical protein TNCV_3196741 [Trichonephila clavipes]|nr:hypothetical protein TNCV_3196741 [Trichonephila clavipes]